MNMTCTARRWRVAMAGALLAVAGCGGGGGDAPASAGAKPLALTPKNMTESARFTISRAETLLQAGQLAIDLTNRFFAAYGATPIRESCPTGGTLALTLIDRDADGKPSAGDRVVAELHDCGARLLTGTIGFEIAAADGPPASAVRGTLDFGSTGVELKDLEVASIDNPMPRAWLLLGTLAVDWSRTDARTTLAVASTPADDLRLAGGAGIQAVTDVLQGIAISKQLAYDQARSIVNIAYRMSSEALAGSISVTTPQPLLAYLNTYPEQGRVEVRGAGATVLGLSANFATGSGEARLALDLGGDGSADRTTSMAWDEASQRYLWWDGTSSWSPSGYPVQNFSSASFSSNVFVPSMPRAQDPVRIQFSRVPVDLATLPRWRFRSYSYPTSDIVPATASLDGALLLIRPDGALGHGRSYSLEISVDGGNSWGSNSLTVHDEFGNVQMLSTSIGFTTPNTMLAVAAADKTTLVDAPSSAQLSAAGSVSARRIASYRWTQLSGPALVITAPDAAQTTVTLGALSTGPALDAAVIELRITDVAGEIETSRLTVNLLRTQVSSSSSELYLRSVAGDPVGQGRTVVESDASGTIQAVRGYYYREGVSVTFRTTDSLRSWDVWLSSADGSPLQVGAYENAVSRYNSYNNLNSLDVSSWYTGCTALGRFDVLEVEYDPTGNLTKLAVDFEQHCSSLANPPLYGSVRIGSSVPLRP